MRPTQLLVLPCLLAASSCDPPPTGDVPCDQLNEHLDALAAETLPTGIEGESRAAYAQGFALASQRATCANLTAAEKSCQLTATSLAIAQACVAPKQARQTARTGADGLPADEPAPALPLSAALRSPVE